MCVHGILTVKELHKTKKSFKFPKICTEMIYIKKKRHLYKCNTYLHRREKGVAIVLGAGVSKEQGAKTWDELLREFQTEIERQHLLDDSEAVFRKLEGQVLQQLSYAKTSGQMRKPLLGKSIKVYMIRRGNWM